MLGWIAAILSIVGVIAVILAILNWRNCYVYPFDLVPPLCPIRSIFLVVVGIALVAGAVVVITKKS